MQNDYQDVCDQLEHHEYIQEIHKCKTSKFMKWLYSDRTDKINQLKERKHDLRLDIQHWDQVYSRVKNDEYGAEHDVIPCLKYGFIVFETAEDAAKCVDNYYKRGVIKMPIKSSTVRDVVDEGDVINISETRHITFQIKQAYEPDDINWENMLTYSGFFDNVRNFLMQFVVLLIFIFLTTPMALFSSLESLTRIPMVHIYIFKFKGLYTGSFSMTFFKRVLVNLDPLFSNMLQLLCSIFSQFSSHMVFGMHKIFQSSDPSPDT